MDPRAIATRSSRHERPGTARGRAGLRGDWSEEGFSLIEVMMTVLLLALSLGSIAALFGNALSTSSTSNHRAQAAVLVSSQLAQAQSAPYNQLGFYHDQTPTPPNTDPSGNQTVWLPGSCAGSCSARFLPAQSLLNGVTFNIETWIAWANATLPVGSTSTTIDPAAYKLVTVTISWTYHGQAESRTSSTIVYPGGLGPYTGSQESTTTTTFSGTLEAPTITATVPSDPTTSWEEIDLSWGVPTPLPSSYIVEWATSPSALPSPNSTGTGVPASSAQQSTSQSGTAISYRVQGLTPSTTYFFEVVALSSTGQWATSNMASAATTAPPAQPCTWSSFTVSGYSANKVYQMQVGNGKNATFVTSQAVTLTADSNASCTDVTVTVTDSFNGSTDASPFVLSGSNGVWTGTIPQGEAWAAGTHSDELLVNGSPVAPPILQSLLVCAPPTKRNPANTTSGTC